MKNLMKLIFVFVIILSSTGCDFLFNRRAESKKDFKPLVCDNDYQSTSEGCIPKSYCTNIVKENKSCEEYPNCCADGLECTAGTCLTPEIQDDSTISLQKDIVLSGDKERTVIKITPSITVKSNLSASDYSIRYGQMIVEEMGGGAGGTVNSLSVGYSNWKPASIDVPISFVGKPDSIKSVSLRFKLYRNGSDKAIDTKDKSFKLVPPVSKVEMGDLKEGKCKVTITKTFDDGEIRYDVIYNETEDDDTIEIRAFQEDDEEDIEDVNSNEKVFKVSKDENVTAWIKASSAKSAVKKAAFNCGAGCQTNDGCLYNGVCNKSNQCMCPGKDTLAYDKEFLKECGVEICESGVAQDDTETAVGVDKNKQTLKCGCSEKKTCGAKYNCDEEHKCVLSVDLTGNGL